MASAFRDRWAYPGGDPSIRLFDRVVNTWRLDLPHGARVLELGCCESDFHHWLKRADPSIDLTGVDVNLPHGYEGAFVQGPAEAQDFPHNSFEAVICLGSFEHFGLGFYGDPVNDMAQLETAKRIGQWLVPGGWWYYDVPWTPETSYITDNRHFRVYDDSMLRGLDFCAQVKAVCRAYAHGQTDALQPTRPVEPTVPFWYVQRLVEKSA